MWGHLLAVLGFKQVGLQSSLECSGWLNVSNFTRQVSLTSMEPSYQNRVGMFRSCRVECVEFLNQKSAAVVMENTHEEALRDKQRLYPRGKKGRTVSSQLILSACLKRLPLKSSEEGWKRSRLPALHISLEAEFSNFCISKKGAQDSQKGVSCSCPI